MTATITHNIAAQRFETLIDDKVAYLSYRIVDEQTLDYNHTIVPAELGGRGLGTALVKFALEYATDSRKKVIASCSFVANYINKQQNYHHLLHKNS
ncbi:GNAT family N-acetyltransferase [Moraxella cuniculi]|nr:GNAT family N-acetyltransferase [Moraxella cuniculi]VEG12342.1 Uncharacterised protein [Moraxella cuniculi]